MDVIAGVCVDVSVCGDVNDYVDIDVDMDVDVDVLCVCGCVLSCMWM